MQLQVQRKTETGSILNLKSKQLNKKWAKKSIAINNNQ